MLLSAIAQLEAVHDNQVLTNLDLNVAILDAQGRSVHTAQWNGQTTGRRQLDLTALAPGHYTVRLTDGQVMAKIMQRQTSKTLELASFNPNHATKTLDMKDVDWIARIMWASQ